MNYEVKRLGNDWFIEGDAWRFSSEAEAIAVSNMLERARENGRKDFRTDLLNLLKIPQNFDLR